MIFPCSRSRLRVWSCEMGTAVPSRVSLLISVLRLNLVLTYGPLRDSARFPRRRPRHRASPEFIGSRNIAYRWRSLPRVRRHRASKPQGSSKRVLPWPVTMDHLICASLSHIHKWYEVGMLKIPAANYLSSTDNIGTNVVLCV